MSTLFLNSNYEQWLGLAALFFIIEIIAGTGFLLWLGISASLLSLMLLLFGSIEITIQLFIFSVLSITTAIVWKLYLHFYPLKTDRPTLNKRAEQYIGREFILEASIANGQGFVRVDDTIWPVKCNEKLMVGEPIQIIATNGIILIAKKLN